MFGSSLSYLIASRLIYHTQFFDSQVGIPPRKVQGLARDTLDGSGLTSETQSTFDEKRPQQETVTGIDDNVDIDIVDPDVEAARPLKRPMVLTHSFIVSLAMILIAVAEINWISKVGI